MSSPIPLRIYPNPNNGAFQHRQYLGEETIEHIGSWNALGATVLKTQNVGAMPAMECGQRLYGWAFASFLLP